MKLPWTFSLIRRDFLKMGLLGLGIMGSGPLSAWDNSAAGASVSRDEDSTTGYVYDPLFLKHTQSGHPESAQRLEAIMAELKSTNILNSLQHIPSRKATIEELSSVHPIQHIQRIQKISQAGGGYLDPDTYTTRDTYEAAAVAVGSLIDLSLAVIDGRVRNGFALVRPPGHHATHDRAMGFCIFSNVAIAAKAAQMQRDLDRIAIIDFDVHHGNGTQAIVEEDPTILYNSSHQYPHYPGTGRMEDTGRGKGRGTVINFPLPAGVADEGFQRLYHDILIPVLQRFQPQFIIVSAGYDCHWNDPLASLGLSLTGMAWISKTLVNIAEELCAGKIVFALEGGYNLDVLRVGVANSMKALLGRDDFLDPLGLSPRREPDLTKYVAALKKIHQLE